MSEVICHALRRTDQLNTGDQLAIGQELTKLQAGKIYTDKELPAIGIGIAIPETKKIFRFKESIDMEEQLKKKKIGDTCKSSLDKGNSKAEEILHKSLS